MQCVDRGSQAVLLDHDRLILPATHAGAGDALLDRMQPRGKPPLLDAALFLYVPFVASVSRTFASSTDDPLITLRYAANVVHGLGPVFNRGQHVQGFTSPLHLCVAVLVYLFPGGHDLLKLKLASLVFGALAIREAGILLYSMAIPLWARRTGAVAVGTSAIVAFASSNGLETTLEMWLLMALARRLILDGPSRSPLLLCLLAFGAALARPDAFLVLACMGVVGLIIERPLALWRRISWVGGVAVALACIAGMGILYYDDVLPNTYYAKDMGLGRAFSSGAGYLVDALQPQTGVLAGLLLLLQLVLIGAGIYVVAKVVPRFGYLVAIVGAQAVFILKSGGDWMHGSRFAAAAVIPLILIELLGLVHVASYLDRHARHVYVRALSVTAAAGLIVAGLLASYASSALLPDPVWHLNGTDDRSLLAAGGDQFSHLWATLPSYLTCLRAGQLVATSEVGNFGFSRQDLQVLDIRGLTDRSIAKGSPASIKYPWGVADPFLLRPTSPVGRVLVRVHPALIATFDAPAQKTVLGGAYRLVASPKSLGISVYVPSSGGACRGLTRSSLSKSTEDGMAVGHKSAGASTSSGAATRSANR